MTTPLSAPESAGTMSPVPAMPRAPSGSGDVIRDFEERDAETVKTMYGDVFNKEAERRFRQRWDWEFYRHPYLPRGSTSSRRVVAERDGEVIGYCSTIPMCFRFGDAQLQVVAACDLIVPKHARGRGLGQKLLDGVYEHAGVFATAYGWAPHTGRFYDPRGFRDVAASPIYFRPFEARAVLRFLRDTNRVPRVLRSRATAWLLDLGGMLMNAVLALANAVRAPRKEPNVSVGQVHAVGAEFQTLWETVSPRFPIIGVRDRAFLQWRFIEDPVFKHTLLAARDPSGALVGYLAFCVTQRESMRIGRIMDVFCAPERTDVIAALLREALQRLQAQNASIVSCMGLHPSLRRTVRRYLYVLPARLELPPKVRWTGDPALASLAYDPSAWHVSYADGDQGFVL